MFRAFSAIRLILYSIFTFFKSPYYKTWKVIETLYKLFYQTAFFLYKASQKVTIYIKIPIIPLHVRYLKSKYLKECFEITDIYLRYDWFPWVKSTNRLWGVLLYRNYYELWGDYLVFYQLNTVFRSITTLFFELVDVFYLYCDKQQDSAEDFWFNDFPDIFELNVSKHQEIQLERFDRPMRHYMYVDSARDKIWQADIYHPDFSETP